jgi:hypothetical protein
MVKETYTVFSLAPGMYSFGKVVTRRGKFFPGGGFVHVLVDPKEEMRLVS